MAEVLTESFCERCGTRYTFESAQPRVKRLKGVKVLSRGLKNFVLSDDSSLDEAMAAARSDTDREITAMQLDAFHQTFNFCMTCRQYTCANCWNEAEGTCLTCSPHLGHEILPAPFPDLDPATGLAIVHAADTVNGNGASNGNGTSTGSLDVGAWPVSDFASQDGDTVVDDAATFEATDDLEPVDVAARLAALTVIDPIDAPAAETAEAEAAEVEAETVEVEAAAPEAEIAEIEAIADETDVAALAVETADLQTVEAVDLADEPAASGGIAEIAEIPAADVAAAAAAASVVAEPAAPSADTDDMAAAAAAQTAALLHRFRPGQNLDAEIEAYEREQAALQDDADAAAAIPAASEPDRVDEIDPLVAAAILGDAATEAEAPAAETEPAAAEVQAEDDADVIAAAAAAAALAAAAHRVDVVEQPTWQIVAPDIDPAPVVAPLTPPAAPAQAGNGAPPEWPAQPEWPSQAQATAGLPFLGRPAQPTGGLEALWAESNREVVSAPLAPGRAAQGGVQPCLSCGLSLSATARFCRRCGTSQVA